MARDFDPSEDRVILLCWEEMDCDWPAIAAALGRNITSIQRRYRLLIDTMRAFDLEALHTGPERTTRRVCLRCGGGFPSTGPGHRLCETCGPYAAHVWTFGGAVHEVWSTARRGVDAPTPLPGLRVVA